MSAAAISLNRRSRIGYDPLRDTRHRDARAAREQADWLLWLDLGNASPRTLNQYERDTSRLLNMFPDKELGDFTDGDLLHVAKTFPAASRRVRMAAYRSWFKWAVQTRRIKHNPMDLLPNIKRTPQKAIVVFTEAEEARLVDLPNPDGVLMAILFETGLRKAEASNLRARDINLEEGRLIVRAEGAKGSKERVVPIYPFLERKLADFFLTDPLDPNEYLWYDRPGGRPAIRRVKPLVPSAYHRWWERCLREADVQYRKPHTSRHTFATRWRNRGLGIDDIQDLLGHASISTTKDMYVHSKVQDTFERMLAIRGDR